MKIEIKKVEQIKPFEPFSVIITFENEVEANKIMSDLRYINSIILSNDEIYIITSEMFGDIFSTMQSELIRQKYLNNKKKK